MFQCAIFSVKNGFLHSAAGTIGTLLRETLDLALLLAGKSF